MFSGSDGPCVMAATISVVLNVVQDMVFPAFIIHLPWFSQTSLSDYRCSLFPFHIYKHLSQPVDSSIKLLLLANRSS